MTVISNQILCTQTGPTAIRFKPWMDEDCTDAMHVGVGQTVRTDGMHTITEPHSECRYTVAGGGGKDFGE